MGYHSIFYKNKVKILEEEDTKAKSKKKTGEKEAEEVNV